MRDPERAREALVALGEGLGGGADPVRLAEPLFDRRDPYELGVALSFEPGASRPRALLYYNPRRRSGGFVGRVRGVLEGLAFDPSWLKTIEEHVPEERASHVLGFDIEGASPREGTLYLEEIDRFFGPRADLELRALGQALGLRVGEERGRVGSPYIWAVDFGRAGPERLKVYRRTEAGDREAVREEAEALLGELDPRARASLFEEGPTSSTASYMVQRAYGADGSLRRHKIYRCFDYERASTAGPARRLLARFGCPSGASLEPLLDPSFGTTSVGVAFAPGRRGVEYLTIYQCLLRGSGGGSGAPSGEGRGPKRLR